MDTRIPPLAGATRALLSQERLLPAADRALRDRILDRARACLDERPSGITLRQVTPHRPSRPSSRWARLLLPTAATLALAGLAAAGGKLFDSERPLAPGQQSLMSAPSMVHGPKPTPARPMANLPDAAPVVVEPPEPPRARAAGNEPLRVTSSSTYAFELGLLEPARRSIARGSFSDALPAILQHQREYPRGQLVEEREALRVRALWGMGARTEAESAATLFRRRYPHSGLLSWMKVATPPR
jgi:hypothetical protein